MNTASLRVLSKRHIACFIAGLSVALVLWKLSSSSNTIVDYQVFDQRLHAHIVKSGFSEIDIRTYNPHLLNQPLKIRVQSTLLRLTGHSFDFLGQLESETTLLMALNGDKRMRITARHDELHLHQAIIFYEPEDEPYAKALQNALTENFPNMNLKLASSFDP